MQKGWFYQMESIFLEVYCDRGHMNITCHCRNDSSSTQQCVIVIHKSTKYVLIAMYFPLGSYLPLEKPSYTACSSVWMEPSYTARSNVWLWMEWCNDATSQSQQSPRVTIYNLPLRYTYQKVYYKNCLDVDTSTQDLPTASPSSCEVQMNPVPLVTSSVVWRIYFFLWWLWWWWTCWQ